MRISAYQYGNTIRFECEFFNFDGEKVEPEIVNFKIYRSENNKELEEDYETGTVNKTDDGKYIFYYKTEGKAILTYEWYGEIDGNASVKRGRFRTDFV